LKERWGNGALLPCDRGSIAVARFDRVVGLVNLTVRTPVALSSRF
jgi:hypothetical protein